MTDSLVTLASLTTMRVGGPAQELRVANTREELIEQSIALWNDGEDWLLLGGGSNTIVSDEGYPGVVLLVRTEGIVEVADETLAADQVRVRVQAGQDWDSLVAVSVARGWGGIEALSGVPGLAGAAPIQNIGAYGTELSDVLHSIEFLDADTYDVEQILGAHLGLGYRNSLIKEGELRGVVLSIDLVLSRADAGEALSAPVGYAQLADALGCAQGDRVPARHVRDAVLALRSSKGMVLDVADHDTWSSGSFFTNPIVSAEFARSLPVEAPRYPVEALRDEAVIIPLEMAHLVDALPRGRQAESAVKLSAAWLIEHAGLERGLRLPGSGAAISSKHTLAITNRGVATAAEVAELARYIIAVVRSEFGVLLVPEPNLYGLDL